MRQLSQNEIARTAFRSIPKERWQSPFGYKNQRDKNEMCPYCKNEDTDIVRESVELEPFKQWYGDKVKKFTVVHCDSCTAVWSFYE